MGFVFGRQKRYWGISQPSDLIVRRPFSTPGMPYIDNDTALANSAVWAAIRLRADMLSTMPVDAFRNIQLPDGKKIQVEANLSPFLADPAFMEWRYSSQVELDRSGNAIGIITARTADNYPANIDLQPSAQCALVYRDGKLSKYRIKGELYDPSDIWHEKQYTVPGLDMGLSPVMHAAFTLGQYRSIQQFATDWFIGGASPRAQLKNVNKKLNSKEATVVKESWRASQVTGEPFVTGSDWEYALIQAQEASADWINAEKLSLEDAARFFGVPADLIDAQMSAPNITYANITQRNLQLLVLNLGPVIARRENAWSQLLPRPRFVQVDTSSLLRMDPLTRSQWIKNQIDARTLSPNEARQIDNRAPYVPAQIKEFDELGLNRRGSTPLTSLAPMDLNGNPVAITVADIAAGIEPAAEPADDSNNASDLATEDRP
jgi:HK97 family phage portal protein